MRRAPVTCSADAPVRDALMAMNDAKVRTVVAVDDDGRPAGLFTLVDLLRRVALPERSLATPLAEVMTTPVVTLEAGAARRTRRCTRWPSAASARSSSSTAVASGA